MLIAEEFLLLCLDPTSGRRSIAGEKLDPALGGAVLVELALLERIGITADEEGWSRRRRLTIVSTKPTDDPVLDDALAHLQTKEGKKAKDAINPMSYRPMTKGLRQKLLKQLAERGVLGPQRDLVLGLFPVTTWPARDRGPEAEVRERLHRALVDGLTPTERTVALIGLLHVTGQLPRALPGADKKIVTGRAKALSQGDWAARTVKQIIDELHGAAGAAS